MKPTKNLFDGLKQSTPVVPERLKYRLMDTLDNRSQGIMSQLRSMMYVPQVKYAGALAMGLVLFISFNLNQTRVFENKNNDYLSQLYSNDVEEVTIDIFGTF
jgi:hypothetical protein